MKEYNPAQVKKAVRSLRTYLAFFLMVTAVSLGMGMINDDSETATIFYTAAILNFIMCLMMMWMLSWAKPSANP